MNLFQSVLRSASRSRKKGSSPSPSLVWRLTDFTLDLGDIFFIIKIVGYTFYPFSTYDGDHLLELGAEGLCPDYFPEGQECKLPLNPGVYGGGDPLVLTVPEIPALIAELLASGTYYADATITLADGTEMACIYIRVELVAS